MNLAAILMMLFSVVLVWGGLATAIVYLRSHPSPYTDEDQAPGGGAPADHPGA